MKTILVLSILFCAVVLPTFAELTDADLDKIRLIAKDEVKSEIGASEKVLTANLQKILSRIAYNAFQKTLLCANPPVSPKWRGF